MHATESLFDRVLPEDALRARQYQWLGRFLARPPDATLLRHAAGFGGDPSELGQAYGTLARLAARTSPEQAAAEYHELFIGLGRGELVPYGSYYQTGFLNEKPLARLRIDMARLGIARVAEVKEPEDHIAALCEMMAGMILGSFGEPQSLATQRTFFDAHLASWGQRFFADLEGARAATFYTPIGTIGRVFMGIEATAFAMEE